MTQSAARASYSLPLKPSSRPRDVHPDLPHLQAIISGGQTGSDQAGLRAAARMGLATGGYAPRGFRTLDNHGKRLGPLYGLQECWDGSYRTRTVLNVHAADATVRIARDFDSAGEICTHKAIVKYGRPRFDVPAVGEVHLLAPEFVTWLMQYEVRVLNVAGNAEETSPGIGAWAEAFLIHAMGAAGCCPSYTPSRRRS